VWFQERVFPTEREDNSRLTKNILSGYCNYNYLHPESFKDPSNDLVKSVMRWIYQICRLFVEEGLLKLDMNGENVMALTPLQEPCFKERGGTFRGEITQESGEIRLSLISANGMRQFRPFLEPLSIDELSEYAGRYYCQDIDTGYDLSVTERGLLFSNINLHRDGVNFEYRPTIKDIFYTFAPSYIDCYFSVEFLRNKNNTIEAFVFRDYDNDGREYLRFLKV